MYDDKPSHVCKDNDDNRYMHDDNRNIHDDIPLYVWWYDSACLMIWQYMTDIHYMTDDSFHGVLALTFHTDVKCSSWAPDLVWIVT